ncbi:MAG: helix-turn-helix domain-containing protein [Planctomycetaceae bacterium]|nr:helix-turn-helix domain-containing protein [Planctomycetaceae bacterium]
MMTVATASPADDFPNSDELLITAKEAARRLRISDRSLWTLTNQRLIPTVRIGRSVRYPVVALRQ